MAQRGQEGEHAPFAVRSLGDQPPATRSASAQRHHVGLGPGLIDEDEPALILLPLCSPPRDCRPVLLAGEQLFFEAEAADRSTRQIETAEVVTPRSARSATRLRRLTAEPELARSSSQFRCSSGARPEDRPIRWAPALPIARWRCDHLTTLATLTPNNAAVSRQLRPLEPTPKRAREDRPNKALASDAGLHPPASILNHNHAKTGIPNDSIIQKPALGV